MYSCHSHNFFVLVLHTLIKCLLGANAQASILAVFVLISLASYVPIFRWEVCLFVLGLRTVPFCNDIVT